MSEGTDDRPDNRDEVEQMTRDALHARAAEVEPSPDAYARLADKVAGATRRPAPWWQSPRLLWLGAAGATAAVVAIALVVSLAGDDGDQLATPVLPTQTPDPSELRGPGIEPSAEATTIPLPQPTEAATPRPQPTSQPAGTPVPTPTPDGAVVNVGRPEGVVWPVDAIQPFGEWPATPEDAAQQFVQQLGGWTLPVGNVTMLDPVLMIADVELQFTGEDGEPFGTSTTVRAVGGFDDAGVANWGVQWALSDRIEIDRSFFDGNEFLVSGAGQGFEGVIDARLVDPAGNVAAEGFFTAGGVEVASIQGSILLTENLPGPGFALLYDIGGLGITPVSLTIVPIELPELDTSALGAPEICSAAGLEPPAPEPDLPEVVELRRQAIAAAAIACDWEALRTQIDPAGFRYTFGVNTDAVDSWQQVEADGGDVMRFLVETLKLNWVLDVPPPDAGVPDSYIWPDAFPMRWDDVTDGMRDALRPLYDDRDFEGFANIGGFAGYRLAIDEDGNWLYFVTGD